MDYNQIFQKYLTGDLQPVNELLSLPVKDLKVFAKENSLTFRSKEQFRKELFQWLRIRKIIEADL
jgi:hypothetical protein